MFVGANPYRQLMCYLVHMQWMLCLVIALAGCARSGSSAKISDADRKQLEAAIAASQAQAKQAIDARTTALRSAVASPPLTAGPCTFPLPPADALVSPGGGGPPGPDARTAKLHYTLVPAWALADSPPPTTRGDRESLWARMGLEGTNHGQYELSLKSIQDTIARGSYDAGGNAATLTKTINALGGRYWDWELVIVTSRFTAATQTGDAEFASGEITGTAFVWSYVDNKIRCAGPVVGHNSDSVMSIKVNRNLSSGKNGFLENDLEAQAFAAAVRGLQDVTAR